MSVHLTQSAPSCSAAARRTKTNPDPACFLRANNRHVNTAYIRAYAAPDSTVYPYTWSTFMPVPPDEPALALNTCLAMWWQTLGIYRPIYNFGHSYGQPQHNT